MRTIPVNKKYGIYDLGELPDVNSFIEQLDLKNEDNVVLDLTDCLIDYPHTSKVVDFIINQFSKQKSNKYLTIKIGSDPDLRSLLNWLFLESSLFGLKSKHELEVKEIIEKISKMLQKLNIILKIQVFSYEGKMKDTYTYGKK